MDKCKHGKIIHLQNIHPEKNQPESWFFLFKEQPDL